MEETEISRRGFLELSASAFVVGQTSGGLQIDDNELELDDSVESPAVLLGPDQAKPDPSSAYIDQFETGPELLYVAFEGQQYRFDPTIPEWKPIMVNPQTQVDEVIVTEYESFFNHTFARPNAPDIKNWDFTDADVTKDGAEIELSGTTVVETHQRGNYPPGTESTPGIGFRITDTPTGGRGDAGYFDDDNGAGVGEDTTDSYVFLRKGGTEKLVYREDWNEFVPDGRLFVSNRPNIVRFPHLFYGGGDMKVRVLFHDGGNGNAVLRTIHTFTQENVDDVFSESGPAFNQPNLPVTFETSGLTGGNLRATACHYQVGLSQSETRVNGEHFGPTSIGTTGWTPLLAWRKRTNWEMVNVKPLKIGAAATNNDVRLELQLDPILDTPSWSLPVHTSPSETSVEVDTNPTLSENGERRWVGSVTAGQGSQSSDVRSNDLNFNLPASQIVVLVAQAEGGSADVFGDVAWEEFF